MNRDARLWLPLAFVACFLAVGIPYWQVAYSQVGLPGTLYGPGLLLVTGSALLLCSCRIVGFRKSTLVTGLSVPAAVLARVIVETSRDPTSHNLWPLEIVIALFVGLVAAVVGATIGSVLTRLAHR